MAAPTKGVLRDRARGMREEPSQAERVLWALRRDRQAIGAKFRRKHAIEPYIADFACVDARLIVEVDGLSHDDQAHYDAERTERLNELGWRVLRVRDKDVLSDANAVLARVVAALRS